jgi:hypothetical protein
MYRWLRNTHLVFGLFACVAVCMYGVSSIGFAHRTWFRLQPSVTVARLTVKADDAASARAVARALMDDHGMRGEVRDGRVTGSGFTFHIARPGVDHEVSFEKATGVATVTTRTAPFMGIMTALHKEHGVWHADAIQNAWGAYLGLVSAALIVLAVTGIYMWFRLHEERRIGVVLLAVSLGFSATVILLLATA